MTFIRRYTATLMLGYAVAAAAVQPCGATEASKHQKIEEMFQLMQIQKSIDQVSAQQVTQAKSLIATMSSKQATSPEQQKDMDAFLDKIAVITREAVNWQKLEPQFADLYAQTYTEEEIDGILVFYRSAVGQAMLAKQPELLAKSQALTQAQILTMLPQIRAAAMEFAQEMTTKYPRK